MHTLKSNIKQAFDEWKKADQQLEKENQMSKQTKKPVAKKAAVKNTSDADKPIRSPLSQQLIAYIQVYPGVTGTQLRAVVKERSPKTPMSYVPAILKGLFDSHHVRRVAVPGEKHKGRSTYAYYVNTDEERAAFFTKKPKSKKNPEPVDAKGITALVPAKRTPMPTVEATDSIPSTVITMKAPDGTSVWFSVEEARYFYNNLKQIFGGAQ